MDQVTVLCRRAKIRFSTIVYPKVKLFKSDDQF